MALTPGPLAERQRPWAHRPERPGKGPQPGATRAAGGAGRAAGTGASAGVLESGKPRSVPKRSSAGRGNAGRDRDAGLRALANRLDRHDGRFPSWRKPAVVLTGRRAETCGSQPSRGKLGSQPSRGRRGSQPSCGKLRGYPPGGSRRVSVCGTASHSQPQPATGQCRVSVCGMVYTPRESSGQLRQSERGVGRQRAAQGRRAKSGTGSQPKRRASQRSLLPRTGGAAAAAGKRPPPPPAVAARCVRVLVSRAREAPPAPVARRVELWKLLNARGCRNASEAVETLAKEPRRHPSRGVLEIRNSRGYRNREANREARSCRNA